MGVHLPVHCAACGRILTVPHSPDLALGRFRPDREYLRLHELFRHAA